MSIKPLISTDNNDGYFRQRPKLVAKMWANLIQKLHH